MTLHAFETLMMIGGYAILLVLIGIYLSFKETTQDFIIGSRAIGPIPTAASIAASFRDGGGIAFWIGLGMAGGYGAMWLFVGFAIASIFMAIYSGKIRNDAARADQLTINETVRTRVGDKAAILTTIITLAFAFCITALQFFVSGTILSTIMDQPQWVGTFLVAILLIVYVSLGGYKSVIITDTIQFWFIISLISMPFFVQIAPEDYKNIGTLLTFPAEDKFAFTIFGMFFFLAMPEAWQRLYSAKDAKTVYMALPLTNIFLVIMTVSLIWMGMGLKLMPEGVVERYSETYLAIFAPEFGVSSWFIAYVIMVFLAITMSTQSSACYTFTSTLNRIFLMKKGNSDKKYIKGTRIQTGIFLLIAAAASLPFSDAIKAIFDILSFFICLAPVYVLAIINPDWLKDWKKRDLYLSLMTLAGIIIFLWMFFTGITKESFLLSTMPAVFVFVLMTSSSMFIHSQHKKLKKGKK